ncbi:hypothetical protein Tco_0047713 [Tanacetum coccineum]
MSAKDTIVMQHYSLSAKELKEFLSFYPIPSEYDVILPKSTETIFDTPHGYVGLYIHSFSLANLRLPLTDFFCKVALSPRRSLANNCLRSLNFIYTKDDDNLAFLPKEPSLGFGTGSPSASVNTKLPKDVEEPEVQLAEVIADSGESPKAGVFVVHRGSVAARIKERKCKTRGGSSRPHVKRKLAFGSSSSHVLRAKNSASKDDDPILSISDDNEGLPDCFELKDANAYHLKTSAITPLAWKVNRRAREFLQVIKKIRGKANVIKARERSHKEECKELRVKCEAAMAEFDQNHAVLFLREKISSLTADVKEHKEAEKARLEAVEASLCREVEELKQDKRDVVSKVEPYAALELVHSDELVRLVGTLASSAITYGCCRAYEQVAAMKKPFDLSKSKGCRSSYKKEHTQASNDFSTATFPWLDEFVANAATLIEALLSKKPPVL